MHIPPASQFERRQNGGSNGGNNNTAVIVSLAVVAGAVFSFVLYVCIRTRLKPNSQPFYRRWFSTWPLKEKRSRRTNNDHLEPITETTTNSTRYGGASSFDATSRHSVAEEGAASNNNTTTTTTENGVDRNTSVRSVMTLPSYMQAPRETEQVLGREGERGGVDTVINFPDIAEAAEEERREEEMEALYQVRLARRAEIADREERRRLRREARDNNDATALSRLRELERTRASSSTSNTDGLTAIEVLRLEHARIKERPRAVSSVSYGDLGIVDHDGTRLRANSEESERPLLENAASIGASETHRRNRSVSSVLSLDTMSDQPSPQFSHSRANSRPESLRRISTQGTQGQMSSPELVEAERDVGEEEIPLTSPPEYETITLEDDDRGAPPVYSSPVEPRAPEIREPEGAQEPRSVPSTTTREERRSSRGVGGVPQLPSLRLGTLPSIIVEGATPVSSRSEGPPSTIPEGGSTRSNSPQ